MGHTWLFGMKMEKSTCGKLGLGGRSCLRLSTELFGVDFPWWLAVLAGQRRTTSNFFGYQSWKKEIRREPNTTFRICGMKIRPQSKNTRHNWPKQADYEVHMWFTWICSILLNYVHPIVQLDLAAQFLNISCILDFFCLCILPLKHFSFDQANWPKGYNVPTLTWSVMNR